RLTTTDAEWITSIYSLVFAALLIPSGMVGDSWGRRRMFVLGTRVFVAASLLAAVAGSGSALIGARLVQGAGASMILPAGLATVVFALIEGQRYGWLRLTRPFSAGPLHWHAAVSPVPVALAAGLVALGVLMPVERSRAAAGRPVVLDPELFRIPAFRRGNA